MNAVKRIPLIITLFALAACGDVMTAYYKSVSTTAVIAKTCRDELSLIHEKKTDAVKVKAQAGDAAGAQADLDKWTPVYSRVKAVCMDLKVGAELALEAAPVVEAAATKKKDAFGWISRLAKLGFDAIAVLAEAGIKIPEVK